jgi:GNAT superfamily N-acetyltransferase
MTAYLYGKTGSCPVKKFGGIVNMMRPYNKEDFIRIRDFLVDTFAHFKRPFNWLIERWNFSPSMAREMNGISMETWESQIGIWENGNGILAVVNAEGENEGEAFFQVAHEDLPLDILMEMFQFCETHLGKEKNGIKSIQLRIPLGFARAEEMAKSRNFIQRPEKEVVSELSLDKKFRVELPEGFSFNYGCEVSHGEKGLAHARAFGYVDHPVYRERSPRGYLLASQMPDYRTDFDLYVISPGNEIASFATMWYDQKNQIGILEPVGTIPEYRKIGLGRAAIMQLITQAQNLGARKAYVGSGQVFYQQLGFKTSDLFGVWEKSIFG